MTTVPTVAEQDALAKLIEHHRLDCNRMLHGQCSTRRCLVRGGWSPGDGSGYEKATCEALETCRALARLEADAARIAELETWIANATRQLTDAIGGGSELFVKHGDGFRADIKFCCERIRDRATRAHENLSTAIRSRRAAEASLAEARKVLEPLVNAKALAGVRKQVAGWNGEGREGGPFERHPYRLGATLDKTCCGHVYELDEAMQAARAYLEKDQSNG